MRRKRAAATGHAGRDLACVEHPRVDSRPVGSDQIYSHPIAAAGNAGRDFTRVEHQWAAAQETGLLPGVSKRPPAHSFSLSPHCYALGQLPSLPWLRDFGPQPPRQGSSMPDP
eukprot:7740540-Pyramimonas_sp.AAC.1